MLDDAIEQNVFKLAELPEVEKIDGFKTAYAFWTFPVFSVHKNGAGLAFFKAIKTVSVLHFLDEL